MNASNDTPQTENGIKENKMQYPLSSEVGHLVGQQRERYLEKLKIGGLENDVYLLPPGLFTDV